MTDEELLAELKRRGIRVSIWGCGCCDSPVVKFCFDDDDTKVYDQSNVDINSVKEMS